MGRAYLEIGDINISLSSSNSNWRLMADYPPLAFVGAEESRRPDISLSIHYGKIPRLILKNPIFKDKRIDARLYKKDSVYIFESSYRLMIVDPFFSSGDIYIEKPSPIVFRRYPLQHPFDKLLMLSFLSQRRGIIAHSCGIDDRGKGLLFIGASNAGKSTMARLWHNLTSEDKPHAITVLNDDRIVIRKIKRKYWIYGTPWYGETRLYSAGRAPLDKIFFLKHSNKNKMRMLNTYEASIKLLSCCLFPFWDKKGVKSAIDFCGVLTGTTPSYELGFVPNEDVLDIVRKLK